LGLKEYLSVFAVRKFQAEKERTNRTKQVVKIIYAGREIQNKHLQYFHQKIYDKQDHQGKAAFNERSPHPTQ
jgi:hypothetical protein